MTDTTLIKKLGYDISVELFKSGQISERDKQLQIMFPISDSLKKDLDESLEHIKDRKNLMSYKTFRNILKKKYGV